MSGEAIIAVPDDLRAALERLNAVEADVARRREAGEPWHLGETGVLEFFARGMALDYARQVIAADTASSPSPFRVGEG